MCACLAGCYCVIKGDNYTAVLVESHAVRGELRRMVVKVLKVVQLRWDLEVPARFCAFSVGYITNVFIKCKLP